MTSAAATAGDRAGLLDRQRIIAPDGYNRWLVPPAALAIHLCIGMAYGFSVFWMPLGRAVAAPRIASRSPARRRHDIWGRREHGRSFAKDCDWTQFDLGWMYTFFFVMLGLSAATWGGWLERAVRARRASSPRYAGAAAS